MKIREWNKPTGLPSRVCVLVVPSIKIDHGFIISSSIQSRQTCQCASSKRWAWAILIWTCQPLRQRKRGFLKQIQWMKNCYWTSCLCDWAESVVGAIILYIGGRYVNAHVNWATWDHQLRWFKRTHLRMVQALASSKNLLGSLKDSVR